MTGSNQFISFQSFFLLSLCGFIAKSFHAKNPFIFITVFTIFILVDWSASVNEKPRQKCLSQAALILFTHTCPVTEFAVASHLNTANSCCPHVFLRHFRFQKCLPVNSNIAVTITSSYGAFGSKNTYPWTATALLHATHSNPSDFAFFSYKFHNFSNFYHFIDE